MKNRPYHRVLFVLIGMLFTACATQPRYSQTDCPSSSRGAAERDSEVDACINRGIAYFKKIGAFPAPMAGRCADQVAREHCNRSTTAF